MSTSAPTDFIHTDDENVKKWIKEITETESLLKRMQNELEVEQAKGKLVVSELEGDILKLEELMNVSMTNENNRLKTLMVNQLIEINKEDVLANIYNELLKQRETFVKELPESLVAPNEPASDDRKIEDKDILLPGAGEDKTNIGEDILRIEGKIAEAEKEQISLKQCLVQHKELLDELKILEEFTNSNEPTVGEVPEMDTPISEVQVDKPGRHYLWVDSENYEDPNSSNVKRNPISEAHTMTVIPSEHRATENTSQNSEIRKGTHYGPYNAIGKNSAFVMKTAKRMNRVGISSESNKRSKLDLYEILENTPADSIKRDETSASVKKTATAFKPKTPSSLRKIVTET